MFSQWIAQHSKWPGIGVLSNLIQLVTRQFRSQRSLPGTNRAFYFLSERLSSNVQIEPVRRMSWQWACTLAVPRPTSAPLCRRWPALFQPNSRYLLPVTSSSCWNSSSLKNTNFIRVNVQGKSFVSYLGLITWTSHRPCDDPIGSDRMFWCDHNASRLAGWSATSVELPPRRMW